jgi:L-ascorbate metabolism protein UlaG (beta-lactamase superfamily)
LDVVPGNPKVLFQPGDYLIDGIRVQGVRMPRGPRFGVNVGWRWRMAGIDIVHLGGAALPITREQSILLSRPDLLLVPVGGGPKNYDPAGAKAAIEALQPKLVIPTMYRTAAAEESQCELLPLQEFLRLFPAAAPQPALSNPLLLSAQALPRQGLAILFFEE